MEGTLSAMGFPVQLTQVIMKCISSVSYQILINGQLSKSFKPKRGMRQGDPLSPYLFILCADVLSGLIHKAVRIGTIHGLKISRKAPQVSHLLFADDSLLFSKANTHEAEAILNILSIYERASSQVVNLEKSECSFSQNVPQRDREIICNRMAVKTIETHARYL